MMTIRGFRLGRKLVKVFKWAIHRKINRKRYPYQFLNPSNSATKAMSMLCELGRSLKHGTKGLCSPNPKPGYIRVGNETVEAKPASVPKGHLAVYVGGKEEVTHRYLVPVMYFNHPLFGNLLREAEKEFGYDHPGGIQIPCRASEFETVQTRIAATGGSDCRKHNRLSCYGRIEPLSW